MVQYVVTPWRNREELLQVRGQLYPQSSVSATKKESQKQELEDKGFAVAKVSVWMQRGNCPHLVESTAILTGAVLNDVPGNSTYCVRAAYAAAFCRFVTGLLDSHQDKRRKLSMYSIAKTIGLPATYVELRHQATHEELPSLSKLRAGAQKALQWIWDYYWAALTGQKEEPEIVHLSPDISMSDDTEPQIETNSLDRIRAEMDLMENELESSDVDEQPEECQKPNSVSEGSKKGWALWEGSWIPKPIGVV